MFLPQLAQSTEVTSLSRFIDDESWVVEQKLDGHRLILRSPGADAPPTPTTRNGTTYTRRLPKAMQEFRFPKGEWALDGELVDGTYWVFDMPHSPAEATAEMTLWERRAMLESLLANIQHPFKLVPQARTRDEKIRLAELSLNSNYEGLVLKKRDAPYRLGGRTAEWLKVKYVATADCVVLDVRDDGKESVRLGMWEHTKTTGIPGTLKTLTEVGRSSLIGKEKAGAIKVGDVLEVRYLYAGANGRLYQPTIMRRRIDKGSDECLISQLKHVNKEVLEAL